MPIVGPMLFSAEGGQISPEFYTMLFTMHASVMIFFVIIPILAGAFGNFLIPLMIGADDMAFPTLNMLSYWFMWPAFICMIGSFFVAGGAASSGWTATPRSRPCGRAAPGSETGQDPVADRADLRRHLVDDGLGQLHDHDHPDARSGHDDVPHADDDLGHVHHRHPAGLCLAGADGGPVHAIARPHGRHRLLHPRRADRQQRLGRRRRRPDAAVAALVLVLFAPGRVHHDPAGDGHGLRHHRLLRPQAAVRLQADGVFDLGHRRAWASSSGGTTCSCRA